MTPHREFNLDKPYADFPYMVSSGNYNSAILPRNYKGDIIKNPVGTGPFMLDKYTPKQKATFKKNPTYWGKDEQGRQLPYLDTTEYVMVEDNAAQNLQLQSGAIDLQPQTVFQGAQALFQDPNLRVDIYPGTGIREVAFNTTVEPWNGGNGNAPPGRRLLPRPRRHQHGAVRRPQHPRLRHLLGSEAYAGIPPAGRGACPGLRQGQAAAHRCRLPDGVKIELTVAKYLENPQLAQLIQDQCKPAGITVKINQLSYSEFYAGSDTDYYGTTPWIVAPMTIVEWGSRPSPGIYAAAMLLPDAVWSSSHWDNQDFLDTFNQYESTLDEAQRKDLGGKLSQIQQDDTPIMVPFFIAQARTQKKNVSEHPGSRLVLLRLHRGLHAPREVRPVSGRDRV